MTGILGEIRENPVAWNLRVAAAIFLTYFFTSYRMSENLRAIGVLALLTIVITAGRVAYAWAPWAAVTGVLAWGILARALDVPNHHYMMTYTAVALTVSLSAAPGLRLTYIRRNARWLLVALMFFATVHKSLQPEFLDGSYLGYEISRGGFGRPILSLANSTRETIEENDWRITTLRETSPDELEFVELSPPLPAISTLATVFSISILALEAWLFLSIWLFPDRWITHLSLLAFAVSLSVLRQEVMFISVICALALLMTDQRRLELRLLYSAAAILFCSSVLKTLNA